MRILNLRIVVCATLLACFACVSFGANTDSQLFTVHVPTSVDIVAPADASITHNETNAPNAFPAQTWVVKGNNSTGVNVSFSTASPFTNVDNNSFQRNAKLDLAVGTQQGPPSTVWTVGVPSGQTDYVNSNGVATVSASSNGIGRANLNLTVTFITEEFGLFAAGNYTTTVTGTVAANN